MSDPNYNNPNSFGLPGSFPSQTQTPVSHLDIAPNGHSPYNRVQNFQRQVQSPGRSTGSSQQFQHQPIHHSRSNSAVDPAIQTTNISTPKTNTKTDFLKLIPPMPIGAQQLQKTQQQYQKKIKPLKFEKNNNHHQQNSYFNQFEQQNQAPVQNRLQNQVKTFNTNIPNNDSQSQNHSVQYKNPNKPKDLGYIPPSTGTNKNTNLSSVSNSNTNTSQTTTVATTGPSTCAKCGKQIVTKSVKALGRRYHTQCFGCADCGTPILSKYFPFEASDGQKLPLCEEHFYKRRGLLCCVCDSFLKGTHYTVFGRKYDVEHFCCKICSKKFETDEDFFNHDNNIYCHYHFSKFFIERCEGCEFAILKQYVEIFRGGKNQKWHVECYMIHKCWNVTISPTTIGISPFPKLEPTDANIKNSQDSNPTPDELLIMEAKASEKVAEIWNSLFKFEEDTATCISDMLQFTTSKDQQKGLEATAKLVFKINALFKSIDSLHKLGIDPYFSGVSSFQPVTDNNIYTLKKEPRNLSAKIMVYLAILRKISKGLTDSSESQDLILSVVTGLAHYLKSLIRYGLNNSLQYNKSSHTTSALDKFLREVRNHEAFSESDVFAALDVPLDASDLCFQCQKSIESECAQYQDKRWHFECISCNNCHKSLKNIGDISDAAFNSYKNIVLCSDCALEDHDAYPGFKPVSKLLQLSYLLKIAVLRSKAVMEYEIQSGINKSADGNENSVEASLYEQNYLKTLNDIKRLRSTRQNTKVTIPPVTKENVRKSVVIESVDGTESPVKISSGLGGDFNLGVSEEEIISKQRITVEDEPLGSTQLSKKSFNRATSFINSQKVLTLDDIPRIVAAEHARELRPNTYKFHNPYQQEEPISKGVKSKSNSINRNFSNRKEFPKSSIETPVVIKYYSELSDQKTFILRHISSIILRHLLAKYSVGKDIDVTKLFELKKSSTFWDKLRGIGGNSKNSTSLSKVFGADLKELTSKTGVESSQSNGPTKVKIPLLIDDLLTALYEKDMSIEGVFRKNGNLKTLRELTETIDANPTKTPALDKENAIQLSALLKRFLREMPNPLLTFNLYDLWILSQKTKDKVPTKLFTELSYSLLPKAHRDLSEVLFFFFMWTSSFSHIDEQSGSKMDIHNLATVISPNILYAKPSEVTRPSNNKGLAANTYHDAFGENEGENYYLAIEVVDYLITHNEKLSIVPQYLLELYSLGKFNENTPATSKELFAKIESLLDSNPKILEKIISDNALSGIPIDGEEPSLFEENKTQQALQTTFEEK